MLKNKTIGILRDKIVEVAKQPDHKESESDIEGENEKEKVDPYNDLKQAEEMLLKLK